MAELPKPPKRVTLHYNAAGDFMFKDDSGRLVICGGKSFGPDVEAVYVLERVSHSSSAFLTEEEKRAKVAAAVLPSREDTER